MKVSEKQIAEWIEEYLNSTCSTIVLNRELSHMMIHRLQCDIKDQFGVNVSKRWLDFINQNLSAFEDCKDFESIYKQVEEFAKRFRGIGKLTIYDTATCIGCPKKLYPEIIYIHCGTAEGAKALGIEDSIAKKEKFVEVCKAFEKLEPIQIEEFLCIYKKRLKGETASITNCGC